MGLPDRNVLVGLVLGAVSATVLGGIGPGMVLDAIADESVTALDGSSLVKFENRDYSVTYEDGVSTAPLANTTIRKIEYGKTSFVDIATTETGTYSSEALFSPHFRYPGIHVKPAPDGRHHWVGAFSFWRNGSGWVAMNLNSASSIIDVGTRNARLHMHNGTTCVTTRNYSSCN